MQFKVVTAGDVGEKTLMIWVQQCSAEIKALHNAEKDLSIRQLWSSFNIFSKQEDANVNIKEEG